VKRVHVLVEGQTEETFVRSVLGSHLASRGVLLTPILVATKRVKSGRKFKGGIHSYGQVRRDLLRLLGDSAAVAVTTMIDFYGLPRDFPGAASLSSAASSMERVSHLETALSEDLADPRLLPYLSVHEFEALLFAAPEEVEQTLTRPGLASAIGGAPGVPPEEVNDGEDTHPAARILSLAPHYRKALHGPLITSRVGLDQLRRYCPHFSNWVGRLEGLVD